MEQNKFLSGKDINDLRLKKIMFEEIKSKLIQKINSNDPDFIKALKLLISDDKTENNHFD
jgi:hypothetical protein